MTGLRASAGLATGYTLNSPHVMRFQSSGTSGDRFNSAILAYDLARRLATALGAHRRFDSEETDTVAHRRGPAVHFLTGSDGADLWWHALHRDLLLVRG